VRENLSTTHIIFHMKATLGLPHNIGGGIVVMLKVMDWALAIN
jgi:hypothetical protein